MPDRATDPATDRTTNPVTYAREGQIAVITVDNPPVNALGHAVRAGLVAAIEAFDADADAHAAIVIGAGRLFIGGADITEFGRPLQPPSLPFVVSRIEASPKPVIAAIHGVALGGGLEVALGCHYRIAAPNAQMGLPEVTLGLLPGAGGTQRLPRLTGIDAALAVITSGKPVKAQDARELGIIDRVAEGDLRAAAKDWAAALIAAGDAPRRTSELPAPPAPDAGWEKIDAELARLNPNQPAPRHAAKALRAASERDFTAGLIEERRLFDDLMETTERAALIHAFMLQRKVAHLPEIKGVAPREITHIGVIGGGTMGAGIATSCLLAGLPVTLVEASPEAAARADERISTTLDGAVKRGKMSASARAAVQLRTTTDYDALSAADIAIEAVYESIEAKHQVFTALDRVLRPGAVLATNTSYLDIDEIAAKTSRPEDVIGLHFFSPAHVMRLLEVVVAAKTAPDVIATAFALAKRLGKTAVRAGVCDGFIGNRILARNRAAAAEMVMQGASPYQIDAALEAFGFAMGPFRVADLAGLDIGYATRQRRGPQPGEVNPDWDDRLNDAGRLGRKTGHGYYIYDEANPKGREDPELHTLIDEARLSAGTLQRDFSDEEIVARYMAAMVNEGAAILGDGIARRPLDVDAVLLLGYGFPRHRGGPMFYADQVGPAKVRDVIVALASDNPAFWTTAPMLDEIAERGGTFAALND